MTENHITRIVHIESNEEYNHDLFTIPEGMTDRDALGVARNYVVGQFAGIGVEIDVSDEGNALLFHYGDPERWVCRATLSIATPLPACLS